ncbi:MYO9B protein, partial [Nothoprocta pentlandii]|nr:MYO9B protein [Nothoprocta pentlandii]
PPRDGAAGDLAALAELDEAALLGGLRERFLRQQVYTDVGDILIAMNPFQRLPLYGREVSERPRRRGAPRAPAPRCPALSPQVSERYRQHERGTLPPHIFAVADRAYHAMLGRHAAAQSQCVVI